MLSSAISKVILLSSFFVFFVFAEDDLVFVNILYRHGDRMIMNPYPNDPWRNESLWPFPFRQLTKTGKQQHFELGRWFRTRYSSFLPAKYSPYDIYVRATDVDRVLMSAEANLAGLYQPKGSDIWNPDIKWQPIPIHTIPQDIDDLLITDKCKSYDQEMKRLLNTEEFQKMNDSLKELYEYVTYHTGSQINNIGNLNGLHDTLFIEDLYNFTLPNWTEKVYPNPLKTWAEFSFALPTYNTRLKQLKIGLYLDEVLERFRVKSEGNLTPDRKIWIYSAHDLNIADVLNAFDAFDKPFIPPYASALIMELWKNSSGKYYITTQYKRNDELNAIRIKSCDEKCPLDKAISLLKDILIAPDKWKVECNN